VEKHEEIDLSIHELQKLAEQEEGILRVPNVDLKAEHFKKNPGLSYM